MNGWKKAVAITVVGVGLPMLAVSTVQPAEESLNVVRDMVTTEIVDREPMNNGAAFSASMGPVYYFTEVNGAHTPTHISHIWYYKGTQIAEVPLSVEGPRWRTWSSKRILQEWAGSWSVEAVDADGNVLSSKAFDVH